MTSYTRKLYTTAPSAAVAIHRKKPGRLTAYFADVSRELATFAVPSEGGKVSARIEDDFEVAERLQRWSDRGWR